MPMVLLHANGIQAGPGVSAGPLMNSAAAPHAVSAPLVAVFRVYPRGGGGCSSWGCTI
jgi:hypothetical protein